MSKKQYKPIPIDGVDAAFGGSAMKILPPYAEIPDEFKGDGNEWVKWQQEWFYRGLKEWPEAKDGIDAKLAMKNLGCVQRSFEPKHEHKAAGVAYLASMWFSSPHKARATSLPLPSTT